MYGGEGTSFAHREYLNTGIILDSRCLGIYGGVGILSGQVRKFIFLAAHQIPNCGV